MKRFLVVLLAVVVIFTSVIPKQEAKADGLTIAAISSCAYAIASASGMDFAFTGYDGAGVGQWMQNRINSWLGGHTLAEKFGSEVIRLVAGKLIVPSAVVAGVVEFLNDLKTTNSIPENGSSAVQLTARTVNGYPIYKDYNGYRNQPLFPIGHEAGGPGCEVWVATDGSSSTQYNYLRTYNWNGESMGDVKAFDVSYHPIGWYIGQDSNLSYVVQVFVVYENETGSYRPKYGGGNIGLPSNASEQGAVTAIIPGSYSPPESLNDLQSWEGTVANAPDTNLDQLLEDIFDQSAEGTLDVSGQVVDTPAESVPTPAPTAAPGTIDDVLGQLGEMSGTLEGVQEGVGEAVGQLEGINEGVGSISEALEVPTTSEAPAFKFDLTTLFPFCIPFDIYRFVTMFSASPVAPHLQIPFNIPAVGLQYTFDLDFSSFDSVASVLRSVELIAFCVGLAILTSKVIRW